MTAQATAGTRHLLVASFISLVLLGVVFSVVLGVVPGESLPETSPTIVATIPHVNAAISFLAIGTIAIGWRAIRRHQTRTHRRAMLLATGLFATFLSLYVYRLAVLGGPTQFPGPSAYYRLLYLPVLTVHIVFALCCIPLLSYALTLGLTVAPEQLSRTPHPRVGRLAAPLWISTFALGIIVYALLYGPWWTGG